MSEQDKFEKWYSDLIQDEAYADVDKYSAKHGWQACAECKDIKIEVLQNDLNTAIGMLAHWCVAIETNGADWDSWDDHYKEAMYRDNPLRAMLDKAITEART